MWRLVEAFVPLGRIVGWAMTSNTWEYQELLQHFIDVCWHEQTTAYATGLQQLHVKELHTRSAEIVGVAA